VRKSVLPKNLIRARRAGEGVDALVGGGVREDDVRGVVEEFAIGHAQHSNALLDQHGDLRATPAEQVHARRDLGAA
jgi:hypothetical protein